MLNPFLLTGFQFLLFYFFFGIAVWLGLRSWIARRETEGERATTSVAKDPYCIAYLRAGAAEALKIATISLVDRGLIKAEGSMLHTRSGDAVKSAARPIEQAVLARYLRPAEAGEILRGAEDIAACRQYRDKLKEQDLLVGPRFMETRFIPGLIALACLWTTTAIKTDLALSQGRHNLLFLFLLTLMFSLAIFFVLKKRTTARGDALLADLRVLFARLKARANKLAAGGQTNEAALVAAVFGIAVLPNALFPFVNTLYPAKSSNGSNSSDSGSDGSSCSSGSGSSCGSSCGGGCGGGCGG